MVDHVFLFSSSPNSATLLPHFGRRLPSLPSQPPAGLLIPTAPSTNWKRFSPPNPSQMEMARHIIVESKLDYPTTCNAMETLLIHEDLLSNDDFQELVLELKHEVLMK
ncbi:uncharacterized protein LOC121996100 isoform X2 [Zingiber officinale]|uniref:uncharacterized protein LOC121996100 isoform X2 n=1 Tax=Zingiber officinale TaxID=94328 RepID=UPI001C4AF2A6|nr:uncharacterized protein LOC121996100 isoform X2 [Zingiber officinale]